MKKIIYGLLALVFITSCADEELSPVLTFEKATIGAYIRLVQLNTGEYDLENTATTALDYEVDFVDENNGNDVETYEVKVQFFDNTPGNGNNSKDATVYKTFSKDAFSDSSNGNKGIRVNIPLSEALSTLGLTLDQVSASDNFGYFGTVTKTDGSSYSSSNSTGTVRGSAFQGYFDFNGKLTCPQPNDKFVGSYVLTFDGANGGGYGPPYEDGITVDVTTIPGSTTLRQFSAIVLPGIGGFGPYVTRFDLVCDQAVFELMDTDGLGCGGGGIMFGPVIDENKIAVGAPLDINDDSEIRLIFNEAFASGGCPGQSVPTMTTIVLTKQ